MYPRGHEGRARPIGPGDEVGNETTLPGVGGASCMAVGAILLL